MPRLLRPYIPLAVRLQVAERQVREREDAGRCRWPRPRADSSVSFKLRFFLDHLADGTYAEDSGLHLDHDPPLGARKKVFKRGVHVGYDPPANDPKHLVYREAVAHRVKTLIRGEHGQYPDRVLIKRNRRLERKGRPKPKRSIPSRPFQKTSRKIPSRPFRRPPP